MVPVRLLALPAALRFRRTPSAKVLGHQHCIVHRRVVVRVTAKAVVVVEAVSVGISVPELCAADDVVAAGARTEPRKGLSQR